MSHMIKLFVKQREHIDQQRSTHVKIKGKSYLTVPQIKVVEWVRQQYITQTFNVWAVILIIEWNWPISPHLTYQIRKNKGKRRTKISVFFLIIKILVTNSRVSLVVNCKDVNMHLGSQRLKQINSRPAKWTNLTHTTSFSMRPFLSRNFVNLFACSLEMLCRETSVNIRIKITFLTKNISETSSCHGSLPDNRKT